MRPHGEREYWRRPERDERAGAKNSSKRPLLNKESTVLNSRWGPGVFWAATSSWPRRCEFERCHAVLFDISDGILLIYAPLHQLLRMRPHEGNVSTGGVQNQMSEPEPKTARNVHF